MYNIIIAGFAHETNTFSTKKADREAFQRRNFVFDDLINKYRGVKMEVGGFIDVLETYDDVNIVPAFAANAMPSGVVTQDVHQELCDKIVEVIKAQDRVDGILLSLHGAMVAEHIDDGEGYFIEAARNAAGKDVPIFVTLDLHCNMTERMMANADVFISNDYYPHSDMYERGCEAAEVMMRTLHGEIKPCMRWTRRPLMLPSLPTSLPVVKKFVDMMHEYEKDERVVSVSINHGFFGADIYDCGMSVVAVTNDDPEFADTIVNSIADGMWEDRAILRRKHYSPEEAIFEANKETKGPVIFADVNDNPGSGSTCDGTNLLRAMINADVQNAAVAHIFDPESVQDCMKAGVGNIVHLRLGGKQRPDILGEPIECDAYVKLLSDGKYINDGPMSGGMLIDLMGSAVVQIGGIEVIVSSNVTQAYDVRVLRAHGIEPEKKKIIALKSKIHFRAAFEPLAARVIDVECPGLMKQDPVKMGHKNVRRPIYPLDNI